MEDYRKFKYLVCLSAEGNPDFRQPPDIGVPERMVGVQSLEEAAEVCRSYILAYDLGGGNWTGGQVFDMKAERKVARVSYNGQVQSHIDRA